MLDIPEDRRREVPSETLTAAGYTWESDASYLNSPMDAQAWERIIPRWGRSYGTRSTWATLNTHPLSSRPGASYTRKLPHGGERHAAPRPAPRPSGQPRALTVFPVWNGHAVNEAGYDLHSAHVSVEERAGSAVVSQLIATNDGERPALVLAGDLLVGGQQHRVASRSALIAAGQSVVLNVHCVEEGRWSGSASHARSTRRAPASVRAANGQGSVWRTIRRHEHQHGATATHSMLGALDAQREKASALARGLQPLPFQSGVLIGIGGRPLLLEVFDSPAVLAEAWSETLQAAAFDALGAPPVQTTGWRARDFVGAATDVRLKGDGSAFHGSTDTGPVDVLVWQGRAVHTVATNARHNLVEV